MPGNRYVEEISFAAMLATKIGSFNTTVSVTVFVGGIFDLFDGTCKQHHMNALNPFLNGTKTVTLTVNQA